VTVVNTQIMKAIAEARIADSHRDAIPRPEAPPKAKRTGRLQRSAKRTRTVSAVRAGLR